MQASHFTNNLTREEEKTLLGLAREAIATRSEPQTENLTPALKEKNGAFVSLHLGRNLKGCIGTVLPIKPLYKAVIENAINAAYHDLRFHPLENKEMDKITIEISVLTKPKKIEYDNVEELLNKITEENGIIIRNGPNSATFLPQVWKSIPKKEEFLSQLCIKAGIRPESWKNKETEVYAYYAHVFSE